MNFDILMQCPDCSAEVNRDKNEIIHETECPIWMSVEKSRESDRRYFKKHKSSRSYIRAAGWGELQDMRIAGIEGFTRLRITEIAPGVRMRELLF